MEKRKPLWTVSSQNQDHHSRPSSSSSTAATRPFSFELESTPFPKSYKEALCFADVLRGGVTVIIIP